MPVYSTMSRNCQLTYKAMTNVLAHEKGHSKSPTVKQFETHLLK